MESEALNETWTHISVAAERALAEVKKVEDQRTEIQADADRGSEEAENDNSDAGHAAVAFVLLNKRANL